jgi:endonuclease/exonuclease/phosphatase family metal-dependent hydrolase
MGTRVRVTAANLSSGNAQKYDSGEGIRILQGIHADVTLVQEMNYLTSSSTDFDSFVGDVCGMGCAYVRGPGTQAIPNGIVSRYPIVASGSITDALVQNRDFVWARIDVPGPTDLWAVSVHLLTTSPDDRGAEATALLTSLGQMIPASDYVVVGGDFNTKARDELAIMNLDPMFAVAAPYPADQNANDFTSAPRTRPYDWVLADDDLAAREIPVVIGATAFAHGAVIDTRVYVPLSEIAPALQGDSGAVGMQHMAVVKDFALE